MINIDEKNKLLNLVSEQKKCQTSDLLNELRTGDEKYFDLVTVEYPFGKRNVYFRKDQKKYELLQGARSTAFPQSDGDFDELSKQAKEKVERLLEKDIIRIDELDYIEKNMEESLSNCKSFAELGFRMPRLLNYYLNNGMEYAIGFDVLESNVIYAKHLGYEAEVYDLNQCDKNLDLSKIDLSVCYHVLEHLSDPMKALKAIYDGMKENSYLHVEVPIEGFQEGDKPNIRYCHMFPFYQKDLGWMLQNCGFKLLTLSNKAHEGGGLIERYLVKKGD